MAAARANPNVKWLLFSGHRPLYSSDTDEYSAHQPGCPLLVALEGLINKYAVDLVLTGHEHMVRSAAAAAAAVTAASQRRQCAATLLVRR